MNARDSSTVWMDLEDPDPGRKFKAFIYSGGARQSVYFSPDGIVWTQQPYTIFSLSDRTTFFGIHSGVFGWSARSSVSLTTLSLGR
jgi:hypothetical protein